MYFSRPLSRAEKPLGTTEEEVGHEENESVREGSSRCV